MYFVVCLAVVGAVSKMDDVKREQIAGAVKLGASLPCSYAYICGHDLRLKYSRLG